ncbi:Hsp20/alpha crystallin family protein [Prauserella alba]|uniref:Alpha-crystallin HspX n=2 Tax=Prauserella alba TaxID=176898 RepID=A0ABN1VCK6_9PSEU|nr:Hsp20/alpha crystallin family protein [Prauserella alba]MCP2182222.1 Molecular chaperone IbpA, HSP20 family [Prauserella alba]
MTSLVPRSSLLPDMFRWLESEVPFGSVAERRWMRLEDRLSEEEYVVRAELPGLDPEHDITITVEKDELSIAAQRSEEKTEKGRSEFHYGSFSRTVRLPAGAATDRIAARYDKGILEVTIPLEKTAEAHQIPVKGS